MTFTKSLIGAAAIAAVTLSAGNASAVFYADMTDNGAVWTLAGAGATTNAPLPGFGTVTATASASPITQTIFDGNTVPAFVPPLAGLFDGFGVKDDEITDPGQSITVSWANPVNIVAIYLLDFFSNNSNSGDPSWTEEATITIGGVTATFDAVENVNKTGDFTITAADLILQGINVNGVSSILFEAPSVTGCTLTDGKGCNDYAVAGIAAVPLPGAVWLFGSGLLAMLGIGYTRRRRAAA
ncbi:MAG: hypothetical protein ACFCUO_13410 [Rhodospirillales bacterium]